MRDHNKAFCELIAGTFDCPGPVYEFGSYQVEGQVEYADLRSMFPGRCGAASPAEGVWRDHRAGHEGKAFPFNHRYWAAPEGYRS